jgi:hypothetical protein
MSQTDDAASVAACTAELAALVTVFQADEATSVAVCRAELAAPVTVSHADDAALLISPGRDVNPSHAAEIPFVIALPLVEKKDDELLNPSFPLGLPSISRGVSKPRPIRA